jgi:hypothetical protein
MTDLASVADKLANFIRLLASDKDGEVVAAAHAMVRVLSTMGSDIHDLADRIEHSSNGALNEHEMQEIYDAGIKEGVPRVEQKMRTQGTSSPLRSAPQPQFPSAQDMAFYCYQRIGFCNEWETEFATNMVSWTKHRPLTAKQQARLEGLFLKLGGKLT